MYGMALKLLWYIYWLWRSLLVTISKLGLLTTKGQPENTYSCILMVTGQVWGNQKGLGLMLIRATISINLSKSVSADLMIQIQF